MYPVLCLSRYPTLAWLAGVGASDSFTPGYPAVDGLNLWPYLVGEEAASPRKQMLLGAKAILPSPTHRSTGGAIIHRPWKSVHTQHTRAHTHTPCYRITLHVDVSGVCVGLLAIAASQPARTARVCV
jgi:hypothetical protein